MLSACPNCGTQRDLRPSRARNNPLCKACSTRLKFQPAGYNATKDRMDELGRKGFAACADKYGSDFLIERVRQHLLSDPSKPEQIFEQTLRVMNLPHYEREYRIRTKVGKDNGRSGKKARNYLVDFMVGVGNDLVPVEIHGEYIHQKYHQKRDQRKAALLKRRGYKLIVLSDKEVLSGDLPNILYKHGLVGDIPALVEHKLGV